MAKKKIRPTPKDPKPGYDPNAGTQVGEREYNPNSVTRYNMDQFLKNHATAGSMITPGFREMRYFMDWLQQFVNGDEYNTNPFLELKPNPLMAQLNAGINPYPGTRGYISPTASSRGAPPPQGPLPEPIPGPLPPGNKIPPFMPPPRLPSPSMPLPPKPSPKIPPSLSPKPSPPMQLPKQQLPPSVGAPRPVPDANAAAKNAAAAAQQASPRKPAPKPKQVKPTLNSYIPRYERD